MVITTRTKSEPFRALSVFDRTSSHSEPPVRMGLLYNIFIATFSSIGAFLFGGIIASVITMKRYSARFSDDPSIKGAVVAASLEQWEQDGQTIDMALGCLFALWGAAMQCGASNVATLLIGRIIGGLAIGVLSMTVPLYNTEIAPPKTRGFLVGLTQQMIGIGFIVANWVGYGCQFLESDISWRLPLGLQLVPAGLLLVGVQFLPYSPRWLLEVGRDDEAREVVYKLHGKNNRETAEVEYREMYDSIKADAKTRSRKLSDLWATRPMAKRTFVACGVQVFCQFTGINVINYFGPQMYESLGIEGSKALLIQGIYGAIGPIANIFFITLALDRVGRKKPLMFGAASFVATFSILAAIVANNPPGSPNPNVAAQRAGIGMIFMTSIFFSMSFGPVSWVLASEVFPTNTRALGTSVATCSNWAFNILIGQVSPLGMTEVGWKYYMLFVSLNFVDFIIITLFFPETKGKTLEEMNAVFGDAVDTTRAVDDNKLHEDEKSEEAKGPFKLPISRCRGTGRPGVGMQTSTSNVGLESLPVELLYEIQLFALSESLPATSRHIHEIFRSAPTSFRSEYLLGRVLSRGSVDASSAIFTKALRYPLCAKDVLDSLCRKLPQEKCSGKSTRFELPRRLFRSLAPKSGALKWKEREQPLPFLRYLFDSPIIPLPNVNAHDGYALTKAVHARFLPLIRFLLDHGADPRCRNCLAVFVAIRQKDLALVRLLIERDDSPYEGNMGKRKRRRLEDRVEVNRAMLKVAVKCDARDIVDYLTREKGCIPDMQTLHMMMK
ncbi:hypothetical protein D9615_004252 [Tricholomella constricta]|uniref:Major facilitator superfamily (MFS) profile domain-containing protein n=1 Tax=Tricholomella constricta TaxID=117010 RepID=A0A8H5HFH4_9AGAR|nr:hypothetical protein D9615_004252 [Tricholomella constricta]